MSESLKHQAVKGMVWSAVERFSVQGVQFILGIIIARLVSPSEYGLIAMLGIFLAIAQTFIDSGFSSALIQKKDADDLDFSSVFYFNFTVCLILYAGMFMAAPWIADFYGRPELVPLVRVLSLTLVISGVKNIQQAYVSKHLLFKRFFFATLGGTIFSAVCGIFLAYRGAGVWALVVQQLMNATIDTTILWITVKWRPKLMFSWNRLKGLLSYGWKLVVSSFLSTVYSNLQSLIIGKVYTATDLAYYNNGNQLPTLVILNINTSIDSVLLPVMSSVQDQEGRIKTMTRQSIRISSYIIWPMMIGLAACSKPLIAFLLTDKWLPCVPYLRVFCMIYAFHPIHTANLNAIKAMGRSDIFLKLEIVKKIIDLTTILITVQYGPLAMAFGVMLTTPLGAFVNAFPNKKLLRYSFKEQMLDLLPCILLAFFMGAVIWPIQYLVFPNIAIVAIQVVTGVLVYVLGSVLFRMEAFTTVFGIVKSFLKKS